MTNSNVTRFIVLPDGTCAPLKGCMLIDVPHAADGECDDAEVWIAENADCGYSLDPDNSDGDLETPNSYYDLINDLLMGYSDEQLMRTPTILVPQLQELYPLSVHVSEEDNDVLDPGHIVFQVEH